MRWPGGNACVASTPYVTRVARPSGATSEILAVTWATGAEATGHRCRRAPARRPSGVCRRVLARPLGDAPYPPP